VASVSKPRVQWDQPDIRRLADIPLEALPFAAAVLSHGGIVMSVNARWTATWPDCGPGQPFQQCSTVIHPKVPELARALAAGAERTLTHGERFEQSYGENGRFLVNVSPCVLGALVVHQNVPSASQTRQSTQAHRMEVIGRLVGGVAHDFANLITLIDGYTDLVLNHIGKMDPVRVELEEIRKAAGHGGRLTSQLLGFTRGQSVERHALDLNLVVGEMERMLRPIIGEYVNLQTSLAPDLHRVMADSGQMEQVLVNLILNARDAMPNGGSIRIETSNCEIDDTCGQEHALERGPGILMTIADNGCGIGADAIPFVFEPFFTTKEKGKGTGLGLATVYELIRQSGGDIRVHSESGTGTAFAIWLPAARQAAGKGDAPETVVPPEQGHETVLVVEDEDNVRRLLTHLLQRRGYKVLEAPNAEEALAIFESRPNDIHLVLTDMVMPGMSGRALADRLLERRPGTRVIFMSGYTDDVLVSTGALSPGMSFLQKPLRPDVLAARVREALDSPSLPFNPR
jgi:two-component system, cell cycle sensor histidine kinase and response regulator CckA